MEFAISASGRAVFSPSSSYSSSSNRPPLPTASSYPPPHSTSAFFYPSPAKGSTAPMKQGSASSPIGRSAPVALALTERRRIGAASGSAKAQRLAPAMEVDEGLGSMGAAQTGSESESGGEGGGAQDPTDDDEANDFMAQWTTVSPPAKKRARTSTLVPEEQQQPLPPTARPHSYSESFVTLSTSSSSCAASLAFQTSSLAPSATPKSASLGLYALAGPVPSLPRLPHHRPNAAKRNTSIGTALSSLSLANERGSSAVIVEDRSVAPSVAGSSAPLTQKSVAAVAVVVEEATDPSQEKERTEPEQTAPQGLRTRSPPISISGDSGSTSVDLITIKQEPVNSSAPPLTRAEEKARAADDDTRSMPPPPLSLNFPPPTSTNNVGGGGAQFQPHRRTASSASSVLSSISSSSASSSGSSLLNPDRRTRSRQSTTSTSTSISPLSSASSYEARVPYHPHPSYPRHFARPLVFVYETGTATYEEQREGRTNAKFDEEESAAAGKQKKKKKPSASAASGGGTGGGRKRSRSKSVGWADDDSEEEDDEEDADAMRVEEGVEAVEYVPRPSRYRPRASATKKSVKVEVQEEEEDETEGGGGGEEISGEGKKGGSVRRSSRGKKSRG